MGLNLNGIAGREVRLFLVAGITNWIGDYSVALVYMVLTIEPFFEIKQHLRIKYFCAESKPNQGGTRQAFGTQNGTGLSLQAVAPSSLQKAPARQAPL
jgi:hypothetical protein